MKDIEVIFGRPLESSEMRNRSRNKNVGEGTTQQWKKKSIFFDLPYLETNLLHHNLYVMYLRKNVFDNVIYTVLSDTEKSKDNLKVYTILNDTKKSKDDLKARKDLQEMGIRESLWTNEKLDFQPAMFTIPRDKKVIS